jgi:hypothetical protein
MNQFLGMSQRQILFPLRSHILFLIFGPKDPFKSITVYITFLGSRMYFEISQHLHISRHIVPNFKQITVYIFSSLFKFL